MDASQNSGQGNNSQNNNNAKKPQLSWSQPSTSTSSKPVQSVPAASTTSSASKNVDNGQSHTMRNISIAAVAILVIGGGIWALAGHKSSPTDTASTTATTTSKTTSTGASTGTTAVTGTSSVGAETAFPSGSLVIASPQDAGLEIAVSKITVQVPTWVVIYENYNGQPGNVLGAGLFVSGRSSGVVDLLRGTLPGQTYFAGEARDDGDHMFSMANDPAIRDGSGNPIVVKFQTK